MSVKDVSDKVYLYFVNYSSAEEVNVDGTAKNTCLNKSQVTGIKDSTINSTKAYLALKRLGIEDDRIPLWIARPPPPTTLLPTLMRPVQGWEQGGQG